MTKLLLRFFVKDYQRTEDSSVRSCIGKFSGIVGIVCNLLLFAGKLAAGVVSHSVSILADALNNLSDASASVVTLLGFRMAQQPADSDHPYGHARYEYISGVVVAGFILMIGIELIKSSVEKIFHPEPLVFSYLTWGILAGSVLLKLWLFGFYRSLGKEIQSGTLLAAATDSRNDVIATAGVLMSQLIGYFFAVNLDGCTGFLVALFILRSGINTAKETVSPLLGKQADTHLVDTISRMVLSHEKVLGIHDLLVHDYGPGKCYASVHAELDAKEDALVCHDMIDEIECQVLEELQVNLVIHYDPVVVNDQRWNRLKSLMEEILERISPELSMHDFRVVQGAKQNKLVFDLAVPYAMLHCHKELKEEIDQALREEGEEYLTVIRFDGK